ncbi:MAG TPA: hypothetical protein VIY08_02120 [Candidatus Nitrosocosmicus sp.]
MAKEFLIREEMWKELYEPHWHVIIEDGTMVTKFRENDLKNNITSYNTINYASTNQDLTLIIATCLETDTCYTLISFFKPKYLTVGRY